MNVAEQLAERAPYDLAPLTDACMDALADHSELVGGILEQWGQCPAVEYVDNVITASAMPYQGRSDFFEAIHSEVHRLRGKQIADATVADLKSVPAVLTTNHHGVDYFAQSVQGSLLFSRRTIAPGQRAATVPVLACGAVPLDNLTYPMGMLFYDPGAECRGDLPRRLPVFSNKKRRNLVCAAPPVDVPMVQRAVSRIEGMIKARQLHRSVGEHAVDLLECDYESDEVQALTSYSEQASVLNARVWRRMFSTPEPEPELVYLELERVATTLLLLDLENAASLFSRLTFSAAARKHVVAALDGQGACWDTARLAGRFEDSSIAGAGTMWFWAVSATARRVPLMLHERDSGQAALVGVDDRGHAFEFECTPAALSEALRDGRLIPSLFSAFCVLALARGVTCAGGYYQNVYLPKMQAAAASALREVHADCSVAAQIEAVPVRCYLSGMQAVMQQYKNGGLYPVGPLEIGGAGGLDHEQLDAFASVSVRDAHIGSLLETMPDLGLCQTLDGEWQHRLAMEAPDSLQSMAVCESASHTAAFEVFSA